MGEVKLENLEKFSYISKYYIQLFIIKLLFDKLIERRKRESALCLKVRVSHLILWSEPSKWIINTDVPKYHITRPFALKQLRL